VETEVGIANEHRICREVVDLEVLNDHCGMIGNAIETRGDLCTESRLRIFPRGSLGDDDLLAKIGQDRDARGNGVLLIETDPGHGIDTFTAANGRLGKSHRRLALGKRGLRPRGSPGRAGGPRHLCRRVLRIDSIPG
jgi:hypothetical protein